MIIWIMFVALVLIMSWGADMTSSAGFALVVLVAIPTAFLLRHVYRREHVPSFTMMMIFLGAYCPNMLKSIEQGFTFPLPASGDSVSLALLALVFFLIIAVLGGQFATLLFKRTAKSIEDLVTAGRPEFGAIAIGISAAISTVSGFSSGLWSHYAETVHTESGGIRLELLYFPLLFGFSAAMGRATLKEVIGEKLQTSRAAWMGCLWIGTIALLFIAQSRRMMLGSLILSVFSAWLETTKVSVVRTSFAAAGMAFLGSILLIGSYLWRLEGPTTNAVDHMKVISGRSVDLAAASQNFSERLTYLWIDATSIDHFDALEGRYDLWDSFSTSVIKATPGIVMPDKYLTEKVVCEMPYELLGITTDLPCTPITEGLLFGGIFGLAFTAAFFGITLGIITAMYRRGSFVMTTLAGVALSNCLQIECSAFPIIDATRLLLLTISLSAVFAWTLRLINRSRTNTTIIHAHTRRHPRAVYPRAITYEK
ncbi:MAG TPA: hypothetical protein PK156_02435 [Polyangium sp.]|nr:hypothetical protein [Polyangium sp.]